MEQTSKYGLSQWDAEDRILREDFNADNAKIEAAILGANEAAAAAAASGLKVLSGTFNGTGTTGTRTYEIGVKPKLLILRTSNTVSGSTYEIGAIMTDFANILFRSSGGGSMAASGTVGTVTDSGFSLKISNATLGLNASGSTLYYFALC